MSHDFSKPSLKCSKTNDISLFSSHSVRMLETEKVGVCGKSEGDPYRNEERENLFQPNMKSGLQIAPPFLILLESYCADSKP